MEERTLVKIYTPGGVISPGNMKQILSRARELGAEHLNLATRQYVNFYAVNKSRKTIENKIRTLPYYTEFGVQTRQNICTSYVTADVLSKGTSWVNAGTFHSIMEEFDWHPSLKINITDPRQSWVPRFTGNLNFVASEHDNFWYLYLQLPDQLDNQFQWPSLVYSLDISDLAKTVEGLFFEENVTDPEVILQLVNQRINLYNRVPDHDLVIPKSRFPYFEGMYRMQNGKFWLGFYWRNNKYPLDFLEQVYLLCSNLDIGKICLTPWKSIVIKDIREDDLIEWERLLGQFGINLRHSSNDLNWQIPDLDESAIELKSYLVRELDKYDVRTKGITISIKNSPMELFTSVVIEKVKSLKLFGMEFFKKYNVMINEGFLPHKLDYIVYEKEIPQSALLKAIMDISKYYYMTLSSESKVAVESPKEKVKVPVAWQCGSCLTVYDEVYGDQGVEIAPGTSFEALPDSYTCSLCGGSKANFRKTVSEAVI